MSAAFAIATLLATAGVAAGAQGASADRTAAATTAVAQDGTETVELDVTRTYYYSSDSPGSVTVQYAIENPEVVDRVDVDRVDLHLGRLDGDAGEEYTVEQGLTYVDDDQYRLSPSADRAVVNFTKPLDESHYQYGGTMATVVPENLNLGSYPQKVGSSAETADGVTVEPRYTYAIADGQSGFVTSGNSEAVSRLEEEDVFESPFDPLIVLGDYRVESATVDGHDIEVVAPADLELRESPEETATALATAAAQIDYGADEGTHYAIVRPDLPNDNKGATRPGHSRWFQIKATQPIHSAVNTWFHEYTHTTDRTKPSFFSDELWFHEGYAEFRAQQVALQTGYGSFDEVRTYLENSTSLEDRGSYYEQYYRSALALTYADYRIREYNDGAKSFDDVMRALETYDGSSWSDGADADAVYTEIANASNQTIANDVEQFRDGEEAVDIPTLEQYQSVYGPVPDLSTSVESVTVTGERGTESVDTNGPLAVREGETITFELQITNTGDASGHYKVEARDRDRDPWADPTPAVHDDAHGVVDANSETTVELTVEFSETGTYPLEIGRIAPPGANSTDRDVIANPHNVTVVPADAAIIRDNAGDGETTVDAVVTDETSTLVYQGDEFDEFIHEHRRSNYETNEHGVREFDPDAWADPGERDCLAFRYYGEWRCAASLPPVDGSIPTDIDDDGKYEDLNADGELGHADIVQFHNHYGESEIADYVTAYDFDEDGDVDSDDTDALADEMVLG